jgi:hypothetical protein
MKTSFHDLRIANHSRSGMAVIIVLAFLAIILIYLAGNARTLRWLERDLKLVEQKQVHRLAGTNIKTNAVEALPNEGGSTNAARPQ